VAAHPGTYNHVLGTGGSYASGGNDTTVESLNSGDFRCGEQVVYFLRMEADSGTSGGSTVDITTSFEGLTTGQPGIGHERIVAVSLQEQSGGDGVTLAAWSQSGAGSTQVVGNVTLGDFDAGETVIVRYQVLLGCPTGSPEGGTGVIQAALRDARVTSPSNSVISTGNQTVPFKQSGSIPRSDLTVTKVVSGSPRGNPTYTVTVVCGLGITETLTFTGSGTQTVAQVPQTDTCQVSETNNSGADQTTVSVNGGAAQNATTASITIGAGTNNVTFTNTFLAPDVSVTKTTSPTSVTPGGTITYTIVATNAASANTPATGVVVSDNLDDDLANVAATYQVSGAGGASGSCTVGAGNSISCPAVTLNGGQSVTVTVTARATVASCGQVLNRAQVVGTNFSQVQSPQVTVNVNCAPDITVVKSSSSSSVVPGEEYTYTITATNPSTATAAATGVVISDDLADSLTGVTATVKVGADPAVACAPTAAGNVVSCNVGTLDIGEAAVVTIKATPTPASCPSVSNRATVTGTNFATEQSNQVNVTVVCTPALTITKAATATNVVPGDDYEYRITVTSPASATAPSNNVVITDNLHDGLVVTRPTYTITGTAGSQSCDVVGAGNTIRCAVGTVQPGQTVVVTVPVEATTQSCGPLQNVATVAASNIANSIGSNQVTVTVACAPALQLTKASSTGTVAAGGPITYTIRAINPANATAPAEDVIITDNLDDDLVVTAANVVKGGATQACTVGAGNTITCDAGDIAIGQTATVTISVTTTEALGEITQGTFE
jgi:uncharacterized repeat protein (TIGR01451 family)/fimbrial isopeptide formation D2 family protein